MGSAFNQQRVARPRPPGGRLTLASGTPVMSSEQANKQNIYYTPYQGAVVTLYDGSAWYDYTFSELTLALAGSANWAADTNYDLFVVNDSGTLRLLTGPAWTDGTTRSTAIGLLNGLYVNSASMTGRYGASSTMTVDQYEGLYVGTVRMNANGQTTWELGGSASGGDPIFLYLWNCYNQIRPTCYVRDSTSNWTYSSTAYRSLNNSTSNRISFVVGLADAVIDARMQVMQYVAADTRYGDISLGLDSTTAVATAAVKFAFYAGGVTEFQSGSIAHWIGSPGIGYHYLQALESGHTAGWVIYANLHMGFTIDGMF
jgi:hypothetical protein